MWRGVATSALEAGHSVAVSATTAIVSSPQAADLAKNGVVFFPRTELNAISRRLAVKGWYSRYTSLFRHQLDRLCISMGGIADCFWIPDLHRQLRIDRTPYVVIVQANAEGMVGDELQRESLRHFYSQAERVIFVSLQNLELAERQLGMRFEKARIICNPLRSKVDKLVGWPSTDPCFRMAEVARLELADKQQDHLLKALSGEVWKDRDWRLTFYGSGSDEAHIRRLIEFYDLGDKVSIGGFVSDFRDIWRDNHLHILPSRREGMPLSLIESMACGRPALVTRAGGSAELVEHGKSGWVCPGMHPEVLAESLELAWAHRNDWRQMGEAARERALGLQEPDWAGTILGILEEAVKESP